MLTPNTPRPRPIRAVALVLASVVAAVAATVAVLAATGRLAAPPASRQDQVRAQGAQVMPFDLARTTHLFQMTETGGVQQVVAKDPNDGQQIALIRQHLQHEAQRFRAGDFSDPAAIHGAAMPGLAALQEGATQIDVAYQELPDGAQITYTTSDPKLVTALHQWFGAQLSDHGHDATAH
jgi:hypothetical protein